MLVCVCYVSLVAYLFVMWFVDYLLLFVFVMLFCFVCFTVVWFAVKVSWFYYFLVCIMIFWLVCMVVAWVDGCLVVCLWLFDVCFGSVVVCALLLWFGCFCWLVCGVCFWIVLFVVIAGYLSFGCALRLGDIMRLLGYPMFDYFGILVFAISVCWVFVFGMFVLWFDVVLACGLGSLVYCLVVGI